MVFQTITNGTYRIDIKINPPEAAKVAPLQRHKKWWQNLDACDTHKDLMIEFMQHLLF